MPRPPEQIIGTAALQRLHLAGYSVVPIGPGFEPPQTAGYNPRWTCPHCGDVHEPRAGLRADVYADFGLVWHRPCVPPDQCQPSRRGDRRSMIRA